MALKATLPNLEGIHETIAAEYTEQEDGSFRLDVETVSGLELADVAGLRSALSAERTSVKTLKATVKKFDGLDPVEAKEAIEKVATYDELDPEAKIEEGIKVREKAILKRHEGEIKVVRDENLELTTQLEENLITSAATKALSEKKGAIALLLPHVLRQTKMRKTEDGKFVAQVVDEFGNERILDSSGSAMTITQLVDEMYASDDYARGFDGEGHSGSGSGGDTKPNKQGTKVQTVSISDTDGVSANLEDIATGKVAVTT